jgi:hypothetical protein
MISPKELGLVAIVVLVILGFGITGLVGFRVYRFIHPYLDRDIVGSITISPDWIEIVPTEPLRPDREFQYVVLDIEPPVKSNAPQSLGLLLPDDSVVVPQIQLIDQDGKVYELNVAYQRGGEKFGPPPSRPWETGFASHEDLPKGRVFRAIRIRCDKPIRCARIYWRCFDPWDVK